MVFLICQIILTKYVFICNEMVILKFSDLTQSYLQEVGPFSRSQATDILDQGLAVRMGNGTVDINPNFIDPVDKFTVQGIQQLLFHNMFLLTYSKAGIRLLCFFAQLVGLSNLLTCKG